MYEIVRFCREQGILCQGRGSAANSAVCYCLGITAVDPVRMGLLFERFLSRERAEPPDIDLDIEHERREEVIQHVYAKYGRDHAAMVANVIRYRPRSARARRRQGARASRRPRSIAWRSCSRTTGRPSRRACAQAGLDPDAPMHSHLLQLADEILDFPRHLSIHPGGFLLGHEPVHDIVPIENAHDARSHRDPVGQGRPRGARAVQGRPARASARSRSSTSCFDLLAQHRGIELSMATIPPRRPGDLRHDLPRRHGRRLPDREPRADVDAAAAQPADLLRPRRSRSASCGPGRSPAAWCIRTCAGATAKEPVEYPHPCLEPVLEKTLGVPLFQEQVMRLAIVAADYTPGEADQLRRDMAAWRRTGRIERHRERLITRMQSKGHRARVRRARVRADPRLRRVRLSREPRRELRADRLRDGLAQVPLPGRVHLLAAQRAADGLLLAGDDRRGRQAPRRRDPADRRHCQRLGLHLGSFRWQCWRLRGAHGAAVRERTP